MKKIAVVGMAGVFPQAENTAQFLDNILHKKNSIISVPENRWIDPVQDFLSPETAPDMAVSSKVGCIEHFDFDPNGFLIDKDLLSILDPVHQLVLQAGREAFSQCHHTNEDKKRTGVILAAIALPTQATSLFSNQVLFGKDLGQLAPRDVPRNGVVSWPASILASAMGFNAGSFTLDAACASSLFSIKLACEHLSLKNADIMVAGGVSRPDSLYTQIGFTQLQALSPSGMCSPFDAAADGLVVGEGTGIVVLKRLEDAIQCGDKIYAVIAGAGASNDIEGTLVGPASEGQIRAMKAAYAQASWSPADIQYMECHGSGTPVGDQIELTSIKTILESFQCPNKFLSIGSVKSMIGHLLTAAGSAGFIKTIMAMNQGVLPPSLNFSSPSAKSPLNHSNIRVQTDVQEWIPEQKDISRKAGISAFGFGGINAHLLVEEFSNHASIHPVANQKNTDIEIQDHFRTQPCAIIGMECIARDCHSLASFKDLVFKKESLNPDNSNKRWRRNSEGLLDLGTGFYLEDLKIQLGRFHIPPNQMDDILVQHLYLLQAAYGSLIDAGIDPRPPADTPLRDKIGSAIGIDFDFGATDFHLRWQIHSLNEELKNQVSPPLTFNRTLGALGGIVASRVAREFKIGGPCFTLSAGEASGIKAIETAIYSLSSHETDVFICGCVDLAGDIRQSVLNKLSKDEKDTVYPSEGSAAIVLKRYEHALEDGDRIYGVITGTGASGGDAIPGEARYSSKVSESLYSYSLEAALKNAHSNIEEIGLFETHSTDTESSGEARIFEKLDLKNNDKKTRHSSSASFVIGKTGAVSSLFSTIQCALCLDSKLLPSYGEEKSGKNQRVPESLDWVHSSIKIPRKACISSITKDGAYSHLIMEENPGQTSFPSHHTQKDVKTTKSNPDTHTSVSGKNIIIKINPRPLSDNTIAGIQNYLIHNNLQTLEPVNNPDLIMNADQKIKPDSMLNQGSILNQSPILNPGLISEGSAATAKAHEKFLEFSTNSMQAFEAQFETLSQLAGNVLKSTSGEKQPYLDRDKCLEFAVGKAGNVLGKKFDIIDTYPVRVRLPDKPLMLVDRIMKIEGEMLSMGPGKIITQHDVKTGAWYLDGPKTPVSISIEAGQADLFLCSWLGVDHKIKGKRKYRLLDAKVTFHRTLPEAGETIEYHIEIDRFLKQGEIYLFFFHYDGYIGTDLFISMRDGCAGFFTEAEVENSGGIILKAEDKVRVKTSTDFTALVSMEKQGFSDNQIQALREGSLEKAFGNGFKGKNLGCHLMLPGGRMQLIDRVLSFDPKGGRFGLGSIIAQSDIHTDAWFLTCHFIDDMVMPGTLMYECCAHALRVFTMRIGWITDRNDVFYDVLPHNEADLKCRGPVTRETRHARYEIEIKELGYGPEPYVIADANMFSDDLRIVLYKNMGLKLVGLTKEELEKLWR